MPKVSYALEPDGPKRLIISWGSFWKDIIVSLDGKILGAISSQKEFASGQVFDMPDGSSLAIKLNRGLFGIQILASRDGQPLPGSPSDPLYRLKGAYRVIYFIAGLNLALGLASVLFRSEFLRNLGIDAFAILYGVVYLVLGYFTSRRSLAALVIAIALFAVDTVLGLVLTVSAGSTPSIANLLIRILLLVNMAQGLGALRNVKSA